MRTIRKKERENGMRYCSYCKPERNDAIYRSTRNGEIRFSCGFHKNELLKYEGPDESNHYTEADYETWMRL